MRILIVEDEKFIAEQCRTFLKSRGHDITTASDGQSGMYCYKRSLDDGEPFDLVITDYRMPIKDGAQVIKEIFSLKPDQKIILATAFSMDYAKEAGISKEKVPVLTKPFSFEDLEEVIQKKNSKAAADSIT